MTLNDLERRNSPYFCGFFLPNSIAFLANYVSVVEGRPIMSVKYCLPVPVVHFWPYLLHPAAMFVCDSWATCNHLSPSPLRDIGLMLPSSLLCLVCNRPRNHELCNLWVWVASKTVWSCCYTRAICEHFWCRNTLHYIKVMSRSASGAKRRNRSTDVCTVQ